MTRKDYILIAEALRIQYLNVAGPVDVAKVEEMLARANKMTAVWGVAQEIADSLKRDNARFDRDHFLAVVRGDKELDSRP